jgi:hypothetical protein
VVDLLGKPETERTPKGAIPKWAARYGYSIRAVKGFIATGKAAGDVPPFDHPEKMEDWGRRHLGKITGRFRAGIEQAMGKAAPVVADAPESFSPIQLPDVQAHEMGMEVQLDGYRREFAMLAKMREKALTEGDFSRANNYFDQQSKVSSEIRQLERLLPTILEQRGDFQRTAETRAATIEFLTVLKRSLLGRGAKAAGRLRSAGSDVEMQEAWREQIIAVFRECCSQGFGETLSLE